LPTPGAFVFFFWLLGIAPPLFAWSDYAASVMTFSPDAVVWGRLIAFAWFALFAVALGPAPAPSKAAPEEPLGQWFTFVVVLVAWAIGARNAAQNGVLSQYAPASVQLDVGGTDSALGGLYISLTPLILPLGVAACTSKSFPRNLLGLAVMVAGAVALFVFSERRQAVVAIYLALFIAYARRATIRPHWIAMAAVFGWIVTGPLVTLYRQMRVEDDGAQRPLEQAWRTVTSFSGDERVRTGAIGDSAQNLSDRLGSSIVLYGVTESVLRYGPYLSPSPLESVIRMVPTFLWSAKNDVAESLAAETQFQTLPGIPQVDFGLSPIAEFVFEIGLLLAPLGGVLYGLVARLVNATSKAAARAGPLGLAWLAYFVALAHFDAGTSVFVTIRDPLAMAAA
jgi:hypothetical protein